MQHQKTLVVTLWQEDVHTSLLRLACVARCSAHALHACQHLRSFILIPAQRLTHTGKLITATKRSRIHNADAAARTAPTIFSEP